MLYFNYKQTFFPLQKYKKSPVASGGNQCFHNNTFYLVYHQLAISEINLMRTKRTSSSVKSSPNSSRASSMSSVVDSLK